MKFNPFLIFFSTHTIYIYVYPPQPPFQSYFGPKHLQPIIGNSIVACLWEEAFMSLLIGAFWEFSLILSFRKDFTLHKSSSPVFIKGKWEENGV